MKLKVLGGTISELIDAISDEYGENPEPFIRNGDCSENFEPERYDDEGNEEYEEYEVNENQYFTPSHRSGVSSSLKDDTDLPIAELVGVAQKLGIPQKFTENVKKTALNSAFRDMEDRNNDWLARQIREEERILRRGDLLDLGASHDKSCDAGKLKAEHNIKHLLGKL